MRLGIDACCWSNLRGFGRFTREIVVALAARTSHELHLLVDQQTFATAEFPSRCHLHCVPTRVQPTKAASASGSRHWKDLLRCAQAVRRMRPDVFYFPAVYSYFPVLGGTPTVVTIHDAIPEKHPALVFANWRSKFLWNAKLRLAIQQAKRIVTVSNDAKAAIGGAFRLPPADIAVLPEGAASCFRPLADKASLRPLLDRYQIPAHQKLLLYVGGLSPHKNLDGLLRALALLKQRGTSDWRLAIVGDFERDSFHSCVKELRSLAQVQGLEEHVTYTGYVTDEDLVGMYNLATCLMLPSWLEGFGLPALEAMACGLPVACTNRGSLPEVVADAGLLFDPSSPGEIAACIERLLHDDGLRQRLGLAGLQRARHYSWETAADILLTLLEEVVYGRQAA